MKTLVASAEPPEEGGKKMSGFKPKRKLLKLVFEEGHPLEGLEITINRLTLGEIREINERAEGEQNLLKARDGEIATFVANVVEWNLTGDDDEVLPITVESFNTLDAEDSHTVRASWFMRCLGATVPDPLSGESSDGSSTVHTLDTWASVPMESLPTSQAS